MRAECTMFVQFVIFAVLLSAPQAVLGLGAHEEEEHDHETPFDVAKEILLELEITEKLEKGIDEAGNITYNSTVTLVHTLLSRFGCPGEIEPGLSCQECAQDLTAHVFQALGADGARGLSEEAFDQSTVVLLYIFSREIVVVNGACQTAGDNTRGLDEYINGLLQNDNRLTEEELEELFHEMGHNYRPTSNYKCFDVETIFEAEVEDHDLGATEDELLHISPLIITNLLQGYCIGTPNQTDPESFLHDIFEIYGPGGFISEERFGEMLAALAIGEIADDEHGHDEHGHEEDEHGHEEDEHGHEEDEHGHEEDEHGHDKRSVNRLIIREVIDDHGHGEDDDDHSHDEDGITKCFTGEELLDIFGIDHETGISEKQFTEVCPALVQQILSEACQHSDEDTADETSPLVWLYGSIAILLISLGSLTGGLFIPCTSSRVYEILVHSLIALAVAVLAGDAIIHLVPLALGVHAHGDGGHDHAAHSPFDPELAFAWKSLMTVAAIYAFYLLETLLGCISVDEHTHATGLHMTPKTATDGSSRTESQAELTKNMNSSDHDFSAHGSWITRYGALPVMIIIGDGLHNFADGLAVAAAFTAGVAPGISTSVAVFCHEVPHELGDLAVLLKSGLKLKWALLLNFLSALTAFAGLYVGIPLATTEIARQWIFALAAGMFLYIALADMMPQITNLRIVKKPLLTFVLQNIFFLFGAGFIFVIALYEDAISIQF